MISFLKNILGTRNDRLIKSYRDLVHKINSLEFSISLLSDDALRSKTDEYRMRYIEGASLNKLLPEAFSVVREASKRVFNMRHFDSQILGGIALHNCKIAEMRTGEGKTLMATLPAYLNAISGKSVHIVTVNDYLASRDAKWMGRLYSFLGMTVGTVIPAQSVEEKKASYRTDIVYGTNNEFGFDYLRDNMEYKIEDRRQGESLSYAILDEIDSILIDEARTPLIISGQSEDQPELYIHMNSIPPLLTKMPFEPKYYESEPKGDFWIDEKNKQIYLSESGYEKAEKILYQTGLLPKGESLYDSRHITLMHHLVAALRAHNLFFRDQQYVVQNNQVVIVDEFTGRLMPGRRWSDGLHQAIEAKEKLKVNNENQVLASITFQNYFRMYENLSGMTGTADTEAYEFQNIYNLETVIIPTNKPMIRVDQNDQIFRTKHEKYKSILEDIHNCYNREQPVLVGTASIENSEFLSKLLSEKNIPHNVLNAKHHAREAAIIAEAGKPAHITIATNMAGRGTDIVLGGNIDKQINEIKFNKFITNFEKKELIKDLYSTWNYLNQKVKEAGGLRIIGTERHESRRIDNQLRGRAGRQGDPGSSRFYLSLEDSLMRIFAGDKLRSIMARLSLPEGEPIEASIVNRAIENAQKKVENRNFDMRKQLLEYDNVSNDQRLVLYSQRNEILRSDNILEIINDLRISVVNDFFNYCIKQNSSDEIQYNLNSFKENIESELSIHFKTEDFLEDGSYYSNDEFLENLQKLINIFYQKKLNVIGENKWAHLSRIIFLQSIDIYWREHLASLDHLRQGIHLRGYAQKNPKQEYKREAFEMFSDMLIHIRRNVLKNLISLESYSISQIMQPFFQNIQYHHVDDIEPQTVKDLNKKIGRNERCPCGSGKKFKQCHGTLT
ncbi:MAG: preprotein translocase subunit SecA [Bordetella sp.]|nr:MAG: preprotein translocase subunit SecA [Bordetella sp.]